MKWGWLLGFLLLPLSALAERARIAIVIDDVGYSQRRGLELIALPGAVALAFLPDGIYTPKLAQAAQAAGKPVLLHAPMQAQRNVDLRPRCHAPEAVEVGLSKLDFESPRDMEPNPALAPDVAFVPPCSAPNLMRAELRLEHSPAEFAAVFAAQLARVPHAIGVNNHEGSRLTQDARSMDWLMQALKHNGRLFFLDSRTSPKSIAYETARDQGIPALKRDVFLDNVASRRAVNRRFDELLSIARRRGHALAIGHPYPATIEVLQWRLAELDSAEFEVVSPAELLPAPPLPLLRAAVPGPLSTRPIRVGRRPSE
jgi:uncharacterized protein